MKEVISKYYTCTKEEDTPEGGELWRCAIIFPHTIEEYEENFCVEKREEGFVLYIKDHPDWYTPIDEVGESEEEVKKLWWVNTIDKIKNIH